jgi:predicted HTH domain antitoxin
LWRKTWRRVASLRGQLDYWRWNFIERIRSLGCSAELWQTPLAACMDFATKHGVPLRYSFEDLEEERQTADHFKA